MTQALEERGLEARYLELELTESLIMQDLQQALAEGGEAEQQRTFLRDNGYDEMQGYYFSKPVPPRQIEDLFGQQLQRDEVRATASAKG